MEEQIKMKVENEQSSPAKLEEVLKKAEFPKIGVVTNCKALNVRSGADKKFPILIVVKKGTELEIQSVDKEWAQVCTVMGIEGYVNKRYLKF